MFPSPEKL